MCKSHPETNKKQKNPQKQKNNLSGFMNVPGLQAGNTINLVSLGCHNQASSILILQQQTNID